jgi:chloride channel protein, CIC family
MFRRPRKSLTKDSSALPDDTKTIKRPNRFAFRRRVPSPRLPKGGSTTLEAWGLGVPRLSLLWISVLAFFVGLVGGFGAYVFRELIGFVHNVMFLGSLAFEYDANLFTPPSPWGALVILVPVVGAVAVTFLVSKFAPEAKGHGVPEVMDAIYYQGGIIRPVVAVVKSLASAIAIGTGAAVGREGPIIQIGSSFGSTLGQVLHLNPAQRIILIAAGAGAGIAATFNTPIGGVLFAIELMLPEVSVNTFLPVAVATGTATFIGRLFFGTHPAFAVPPIVSLPPDAGAAAFVMLLYTALGVVMGVAAAGFVRGLHLLEDLFDEIPGGYLRHMLGMLLVGLLMYGLYRGFGHYFVEGVGYATIQAILTGGLGTSIWLLALLFVCKLLATSLSLGSGSSGGIFSPSLFMGATLGAAFAGGVGFILPGLHLSLAGFAMVGMGAMVGGGTGAAMTAVTMIFEMTRDYGIVLPMILAVGAALGVRRLLSRESIYTMKLARRGHDIPKALHANMFLVRRAREVMRKDFIAVADDFPLDDFLRQPDHHGAMRHVIVVHGDRIVGVVRINTGLRLGIANVEKGVTLGDVAQRNYTLVRENDVAFDVISRLWRKNALMALVVRGGARGRSRRAHPGDILGVITKEHVADAVAGSLQFYPR